MKIRPTLESAEFWAVGSLLVPILAFIKFMDWVDTLAFVLLIMTLALILFAGMLSLFVRTGRPLYLVGAFGELITAVLAIYMIWNEFILLPQLQEEIRELQRIQQLLH